MYFYDIQKIQLCGMCFKYSSVKPPRSDSRRRKNDHWLSLWNYIKESKICQQIQLSLSSLLQIVAGVFEKMKHSKLS